jgi:hypothetical protein
MIAALFLIVTALQVAGSILYIVGQRRTNRGNSARLSKLEQDAHYHYEYSSYAYRANESKQQEKANGWHIGNL